MVHVTAFFAGLLALIYIGLAVPIILDRYKTKVALGDGGHNPLHRKIRAHANFAEYVPFMLLLMGFNELNGSSQMTLTMFGIAIIVTRFSHAYSLIVAEVGEKTTIRFRQFGMVGTFTILAMLALMAIF